MFKQVLGGLLIVMFIASASGQIKESAGVKQSVNISVERANTGILDKVQYKCMRENIDFCEEDAGIIDAIRVLLGLYDKDKSNNDNSTQKWAK